MSRVYWTRLLVSQFLNGIKDFHTAMPEGQNNHLANPVHFFGEDQRGRFKLPGKPGRISAGADQFDHLTAKLGWRTCLAHL
jgi:hypothetical protein